MVLVQARNFPGLSLDNLSIYGQDTWKAARHLTLTYGLRWEINSPTSANRGFAMLFAVTGADNPATLALAPQGTPLYKTTYNNFAPRIGLAYQLSQRQGKETILSGGFGVFYDLGTGSVTFSKDFHFRYRKSSPTCLFHLRLSRRLRHLSALIRAQSVPFSPMIQTRNCRAHTNGTQRSSSPWGLIRLSPPKPGDWRP